MSYFSVIVPLYNKEKEIETTIDSVLQQFFSDFEVIIVNDGSTDGSLSVVKQYRDERIKIYSIKNKGVAFARNYGVSHSEGKYVAFLDADDYWHPNHLAEMDVLISMYPDMSWYLAAYELEHSKRFVTSMKSPIMMKGDFWRGIVDDYFSNSMVDSLAHTNTVVMKRSFFNELGGFNVNYRNGQDVDLWIRAALEAKPVFTTKITSRYKLTSLNSISKIPILKKKIIDLDKYERLHPNNVSLKRYLDLNRYSFAIQYKTEGSIKNFIKFFKAINLHNLSWKQRLLLKLPHVVLGILLKIKKLLEKYGVRIRTV